MNWTTPAATDLRFGFEITMYIAKPINQGSKPYLNWIDSKLKKGK